MDNIAYERNKGFMHTSASILRFYQLSERKLSVDRLPGSYDNRVFIEGNYDLLPILREIKRYVEQIGLVPVLAFDFDVPKEKVHDTDLRLLHACKHAIFEVTIPAGEMIELSRAVRDYGINALVVYQVRDWTRRGPPEQVSSMITSLGVKMLGYTTLPELEQFIVETFSRFKGTILVKPPDRELDFSVGLLLHELRTFRPIFNMLRADITREQHGTSPRFVIDYSEVHALLYPSLGTDLNQIGLVNIAFDQKPGDDIYILPPPAAWEMLRHMEETVTLAEKYSKNTFVACTIGSSCVPVTWLLCSAV